MPLSLELRLELFRAVAVAARPRLRFVLMPAIAAGMSVLHLKQIEVFFPIGTFFRQGSGAKANLDPARGAVRGQARLLHVVLVLVTRDRSAAKSTAPHRLKEGIFPPRLDSGFDQITHPASEAALASCANAAGFDQ